MRTDHPSVRLFVHDDQKDLMLAYVTAIMQDQQAAKYVDGVAFHWWAQPTRIYFSGLG